MCTPRYSILAHVTAGGVRVGYYCRTGAFLDPYTIMSPISHAVTASCTLLSPHLRPLVILLFLENLIFLSLLDFKLCEGGADLFSDLLNLFLLTIAPHLNSIGHTEQGLDKCFKT